MHFWFAQTSSFQTYTFKLLIGSGGAHSITSVTNVAKPLVGVTNSVTIVPADWWSSNNDGAGSGLDADLLDGQHGSYYTPLSNISGTTNYVSKFTGTNALGNSQIFDNGTNVGINTATPNYTLQVAGTFAATTKSFVIEHPTKAGYVLRHGSLEGPENGVYFRGVGTDSVITLPEYWRELVDPDSITVNITPRLDRGRNLPHVYGVTAVQDNKVYIEAEGVSDYNYYFIVFAERRDVPRLVVEGIE